MLVLVHLSLFANQVRLGASVFYICHLLRVPKRREGFDGWKFIGIILVCLWNFHCIESYKYTHVAERRIEKDIYLLSRDGSNNKTTRDFVRLNFVYSFSQYYGNMRHAVKGCISENCVTELDGFSNCTEKQRVKCDPVPFDFMAPAKDGSTWTNSELVSYSPNVKFFKFLAFDRVYMYVGKNMPICEERVRFSTYFWEGTVDSHEMCSKFMHQQKCSLIHVDVLESPHTWTEFNSTLVCYGIRSDTQHMASGFDPDWVLLYHSTRVAWTVAGEFMYFVHRGKYYWVSSSFLIYGMGVFDNELRGVNFGNGTVSFIPLSMFIFAEAESLERLLKKVDFYMASYTRVGYHNGCVETKNPFVGLKMLSDNSNFGFYVAKSRGKCLKVRSQNIYENDVFRSIHLDVIDVSDNRRWYERFADDVLTLLFSMIEGLFVKTFSYMGRLFIEINIGEVLLFIFFYMLLFRLVGFVPAAFVSLVLFTITMQWGKIDPG